MRYTFYWKYGDYVNVVIKIWDLDANGNEVFAAAQYVPLMQNKSKAIGVGGNSGTELGSELSSSITSTVSEGWTVDRNNLIEFHFPYHGRTINIANQPDDDGVNPDLWTSKHPSEIVGKDEFYWDIEKVHSYGSHTSGLPAFMPEQT